MMTPSHPARRHFLAIAAGATAGIAAGAVPATARAATRAVAATAPRASGITWPAGQVLPTFAAPLRLDVADLTDLDADQQLLLTTLQGVVNRTRPRIYLLQPQSEGLYTWLDDLAVPYDVTTDLLGKYRGEITGAVVYDPHVPATVNVATTLAGLRDAVVTSAAQAESAGLAIVADLRGTFATDLDAYTWAAANLWPRTTHRMLIGLDPGIDGYLRDYAVATRGFVAFLDPGTPAELALLRQLLKDIEPGSAYLGWWPSALTGEDDGTQVTSEYGLVVVASDFSANLTVFGGARARVSASQRRAQTPPLQNKIYVTFTMTDGDNLQYNQHRMRQMWADPARGKVPVNWTVQPIGVDAAPAFLSYYQRTATGNDYLMAGPSGAGYVYPGDWPAAELKIYTKMTQNYLKETGIDAAVILNRFGGQDVPLDVAAAQRYVHDVRPLGLLESWSSYTWTTPLADGTPLSVSWMVSTVEEGQQAIEAASQGWDGTVPLFLSIGILAWNLMPSDVLTIAGQLGDDYVVVRGDQFFELARQMDLVATGANLLGDAPAWLGPVENGVGSIPGTLTSVQGVAHWTETSAAPNSWIWADPASQLAGGSYYDVSVTVQGTGDVYLDFWNGQNDLTTGSVQLTATPVTLALRAWVPTAADTHLQVRTAATGPVDLYASAAEIYPLGRDWRNP
jgi:hypothetical protein